MIDFHCYLRGIANFPTTLWTNSYFYSPIFSVLLFPLRFLPVWISELIWLIALLGGVCATIYLFVVEKIPKVLLIFYLMAFRDGNVDVLLVPFIILVIKECNLKSGFLFGLCLFKPTIIVGIGLMAIAFSQEKEFKQWIVGIILGGLVNWGFMLVFFVINFPQFMIWINDIIGLLDRNSTGWGLHYTWLWLIIYKIILQMKNIYFKKRYTLPKHHILLQLQ